MAGRPPAPWRQKLAAAPLSILFLYYSIFFGGLMWLFSNFGGDMQPLTAIGAVIEGLFFGIFMTLFTYLGRRRFKKQTGGDASNMIKFALIVKSGELPEDPDVRKQLKVYLPDMLKRQKRTRILGSFEFAVFTLLGVALAVSEHSIIFSVFTLLFVFFLVYIYLSTSRNIDNIEKLLNTLDIT